MLRYWAILLVIPAVSCGSASSTSAPAPSADTGDFAEASVDAFDAPASDSPGEVAMLDAPTVCGTKVGDILCDLPYEGYVRDGVADGLATSVPYGAAKLSEILARGSQKYAFVWSSGYW